MRDSAFLGLKPKNYVPYYRTLILKKDDGFAPNCILKLLSITILEALHSYIKYP